MFNQNLELLKEYNELVLENSKSIDEEYFNAVERGDMDTAQRMVDEAVELSFKNSVVRDDNGKLKKVYHGTDNEFAVFEPTTPKFYSATEGLYFFADNKQVAKNFGNRVIEAYINIDNPTYESNWDVRTWNLYDDTGNYGFIAQNTDTGGGFATQYAVEKSSQIKSADPITRDASGNIIPLSQRFDSSKDDIRY